QLFVDRVLALEREHRNATKAELFVKAYRLLVVVQDGKIEIGRTSGLQILGNAADQHLADAGMARMRIDRQAPQRRAALWIVEKPTMIDTRDGADNFAARFLLGNEIGQGPAVTIGPEE